MDLIDKWSYKLFGIKIPVFRIVDDEHGKVKSITLSNWVRRENSLLDRYNVIGAEITSEGLIHFIDTGGKAQPAYVAWKGHTAGLYLSPWQAPNCERVIGAGAMMDDISESMDLGKSMKNLIIGAILGAAVYAVFLGPMLQAMMS